MLYLIGREQFNKKDFNHNAFLINMQVQRQNPHPGMSIMRVDSRELPLSAIPLWNFYFNKSKKQESQKQISKISYLTHIFDIIYTGILVRIIRN